ncbi:MAG: M56 family metallopeptidase, partial [Spirochaetota bacterium]
FLVVYFIIHILKKLSPEYKHLLWFFVICGFIIIPIISVYAPVLNFNVLNLPAQTQTILPLTGPFRGINHGLSWSFWAMIIWIVGIVIFSFRILIGKITLSYLAKRAHSNVDEKYTHILRELEKELGITREVLLLKSRKIKVPFTCKVFKPIIVLPFDADDWSVDRIRVVLTHELAHILRKDNLTQFIARMICSLFWYLPFVWIAYSNLYLEQEKVADSFVANTEAEPADYAEHLLSFARYTSNHIMPAGLFLSRGRKMMLEKRILSLLNFKKDSVLSKGQKKMKIKYFILVVILVSAFIVLVGSCETSKKAHVAIEEGELYGSWVNEEMVFDKMVIHSDGTLLLTRFVDSNLPTYTFMITTKDSWSDKNGNKYFKSRITQYIDERPLCQSFILMRINEPGTVLELNINFDAGLYEDDIPENYPNEINPGSYDSDSYWMYYRQ